MPTILLGDYGSGKTTTAQYLVKQHGGVHLRSEMLTRGNVPMVDKLKKTMKPYTNYYLDGWNGNYSYGDIPKVLGAGVRYIVCMAAPERVQEAQKKKKTVNDTLPLPLDYIRITTQHSAAVALTYDDAPLFADTTTYPPTFWSKKQWLSRWMEINLYGQLKDKGEYQDVELSGYTIRGLSRSYLTWERLAGMVGFKDKSVVDYGCNYGYFSFKAEEAGAASVTGVDISPSVLATTRSIAMVKNSKVHFVISDLYKYRPKESDIIMALNTLHHIGYDRKVLLRIFGFASTVILELPARDLWIVAQVARKYHYWPTLMGSHREGRCIVIYNREWRPLEVARKYEYHPKSEAFKWWCIRFASRYFPFKGLKRRIWRVISR